VLERLHAKVVIAILRAPTVDTALRAVEALVRGGVSAIEITYSTPDVALVLRRLVDLYGDDVVLGAGTVTEPGQVGESADAGAQFLVSPGYDDDVVAAMQRTDLAMLIGAFAPSEAMRVSRVGADAIKLFLASLGGPEYLRAIRGPFPYLKVVPTGGITVANISEWLGAGALAVGASGSLCPVSSFAENDYDLIHRNALAFTEAAATYEAVTS